MRARWRWLTVALVPVLLGALFALLVAGEAMENHRLYLEGRLLFVAPLVGLLCTGFLLLILLIDLRAAREAEATIVQHQAEAADERRRFLRRLDHELKNPLTAIRAGLANLAWLPAEEGRGAALDSVDAQALRLSRLASDLRKLAELEVRTLELAPVDVGQLLREVVDVIGERPEAEQRRFSLSVPQAPWPLSPVEGDQDLLFLALHNLVDNALKFTARDDTIEIRAFEDGSRVVVEIADTGPGIPQEDMDHIWDELYRGQSARGIPGSGLGLPLVRAIAERHRGQVELRSRSGQGTVFTLRLPAQAR